MQTEVAGVVGTPLKTDLSSQCMGQRLKLRLQDVPGGKPTQYLADFEWMEVEKDGTVKMLHKPRLMTTAGVPATIRIGEETGDRFQLDLTVTEGASAPNKPKPAKPNPTSNKQAAAPRHLAWDNHL